jgi:outer membrane protein assembly factor BamB
VYFLLFLLLMAPAALQAHDPITTKLTWSQEISRLVYKRCSGCHRDGGRSMPLMTYEQARPWAKAIRDEVLKRSMPPWGAIKGFGEFRNDPSLTQDEITRIAQWVEGGSPEGDPVYLPVLPAVSTREPLPAGVRTRQLPASREVVLLGIQPQVDVPEAKITAALPDGTIEPLLWLHGYKRNWDRTFVYRKPLKLPAGTRIAAQPPVAFALLVTGSRPAWPRFRGPNGSGVSDATGLPVEFGPNKNLGWRTTVPAGSSSPIVSGERVFLTGYEEKALVVLCLNARSGKELWRHKIGRVRKERQSRPNGPATPTPVTDGRNVYVFFPELGLLSYTIDGRERWRVPLGPFNPPHGMATSPVLAGDNVILAADQVSGSFVGAFRSTDGKLVWKAERPSLVGGYSTPVIYSAEGGVEQVVVSSPTELAAYSVQTGEKLWSASRMGVMPISVPVYADGTFFVNNGAVPPFEDLAITFKADKNRDGKLTPDEFPDPAFQNAVRAIDKTYGNGDGAIDSPEWNGALKLMQSMNALVAVRAGAGVPPNERELWRMTKGLSDVPSPLLYEDTLYTIRDGGILTSFHPKTGEILKQTRLQGALDKYFASPVAADGKIYLASESGKIAVVRGGAESEMLAVNDVG